MNEQIRNLLIMGLIGAVIIGALFLIYGGGKDSNVYLSESVNQIVNGKTSPVILGSNTTDMLGTRGKRMIKDAVGNNDIYDWASSGDGEKMYNVRISGAIYKVIHIGSFYMIARARSDSYCIKIGDSLHCEIPVEFKNTNPVAKTLTNFNISYDSLEPYNPEYYYSYDYDTYFETWDNSTYGYNQTTATYGIMKYDMRNVSKRVYYNYTKINGTMTVNLSKVGVGFMSVVDLPLNWSGDYNVVLKGKVNDAGQIQTITLDPSIGISNCTALQNMNLDTSADYYLTGNIDCTGVGSWTRIGNPFTGTLNGNNYTVYGLSVTMSGSSQGMFHYLNRNGKSISDIAFENISITASADGLGTIVSYQGSGGLDRIKLRNVSAIDCTTSSCYNVGTLITQCAGNVTNVYAVNSYAKGGKAVGGLIGTSGAGCSINNTYVINPTVVGGSAVNREGFGGLIGSLIDGAKLYNSFSDNATISTSGSQVGALIGSQASGIATSNSSYHFDNGLTTFPCSGDTGESGCINVTGVTDAFYRNNATTIPINRFNTTDIWQITTGLPTLRGLDGGGAAPATPAQVLIDFRSQTPADISTTNIANVSVQVEYNITTTNTSNSINTDSVQLYWLTNGTSHSNWTWYINGTIPFRGFTTAGVTKSNVSSIWNFTLGDNIYPYTGNLNNSAFDDNTHSFFALSSDNTYIKTRIYNVTNQTSYNFLEYYAYNTSNGEPNTLRIYYCNSSYVTGDPTTAVTCTQFGNVPNNQTYNHLENNSKYWVVGFPINTANGTIGNVKITQTSYFLLRGRTVVADRWEAGYVSQFGTFGETQTTINAGTSWTNLSGSQNIHLHQMDLDDTLLYYVVANDSYISNVSVTRIDLLNQSGLPPSSPNVYSPTIGNYTREITINYTAAVSPNGYAITYYNINLHYANDTILQNITVNNSQNLSFVWNSSNFLKNGSFNVHVRAHDVNNLTSLGESEIFYIDNLAPNFTASTIPNSFIYSPSNVYTLNWSWMDDLKINTIGVEFNGTNYTMNNLSSTLYNWSTTGLKAGNYTYYFWSNDSFNNLNKTVLYNFTVNKSAGIVYTYIDGSRANTTAANGTTLYINGTLVNGLGNIQLYVNNTLWNTGTSPLFNQSSFTTGNYSIMTNYTGNENYTSASELWNLEVLSTPPSDIPQYSNQTNPSALSRVYSFNKMFNFSINWNDYGGNNTLSVYYQLDNLNYTPSNSGANYYINFTNLRATHSYYFRWIAVDNGGNVNATPLTLFELERGTPTGLITITPSTTVLNGTQTTATATESNEGDSDVIYNLYRDNVLVSNPDIQNFTTSGTRNYKFNSSFSENYSATILDTKSLVVSNVTFLWPTITFNNSLSTENLTFTGNQNITRYIAVPQTVTYVTTGIMNLTGLTKVDSFEDTFDGWSFINQQSSNLTIGDDITNPIASDGNYSLKFFSIGGTNVTIYKNVYFNTNNGNVSMDLYGIGLGTRCYQIFANGVSKLYTCPGMGWNRINISANNGDLINITFNENIELSGWIDNIRFYNNDTTPVTPKNVNLSIGNTSIFYNSDRLNSTNRTSNFNTIINSYLSTCTYTMGFCQVPVQFSSSTSGVVRYSNMLYTNRQLNENSVTYNSTTVETATETFRGNFSFDSAGLVQLAANLTFNGLNYPATITNTSNELIVTSTIDIPNGTGSKNWYFTFGGLDDSGAAFTNTSIVRTQTVEELIFTLCNTTVNTTFINFTFKNETTLAEAVKASFIGTFQLFTGSGSVVKNYTYTNGTENTNYAFCILPSNRTYNMAAFAQYANSYSQERTFVNNSLNISSSMTTKELLLLPNTDGIYITFVVQDTFTNRLSGALIDVKKTSGSVPVEQKYTDGTGIAAFWLDTTTAYTITVTKDGYNDYSTGITPTTSPVTITMTAVSSSTGGGISSSGIQDTASGVRIRIAPRQKILDNGTTYSFDYNISSTQHLSSYSFTLWNSTDQISSGASGSSQHGGNISVAFNTGTQSYINMRYSYTINGNVTTGNVYWTVVDPSGTDYSILHAIGTFNDFTSNTSTGIFGLKRGTSSGDFSFAIIIFLIVFVSAGLMTYKYGISSPTIVVFFIFSMVLFLDVGAGLIPNPINAVPNFPSVMMSIILIGMFIKEVLD